MDPIEITPAEMAYLQQYDWPGNVRELRNLIERSLIVGALNVSALYQSLARAQVQRERPALDGPTDLQTLEKALLRLEKEARVNKDRKAALDNAKVAQGVLEAGDTLYAKGAAAGVDLAEARALGLLTTKPFIYVFNLDEDQLTDTALQESLAASVAPADSVFLNAKLEMDLMDMSPEDALEMLEGFGATESGLDQLARVGFHTLGLQTYLTAGPKESRAWTIGQGWTAPQAAGVIHTDFQRGFIKAEIVSFADLDEAGSMNAAKAAGKVRIEGKEYVMHDGDVVEFRFNV